MQHSSTCNGSSSQAQDGAPRQEVRTDQNNTAHTGEGSRRLLSYLRKEVTVAVGRVMGVSIEEEGCYRIVIDGIFKANELLLGRDNFWRYYFMADFQNLSPTNFSANDYICE